MDIKDWILIGGGILLAAVIGHGFWLAWRSRRDTLRMDIEPNVPREEVDELDLLRAELPNGGARVKKGPPPEQGRFRPRSEAAGRVSVITAKRDARSPSVARSTVSAQRKTLPRRRTRSGIRSETAARRSCRSDRASGRARLGHHACRARRTRRTAARGAQRIESGVRRDRHQCACAQRCKIRWLGAARSVFAQRSQIRRHEHLP